MRNFVFAAAALAAVAGIASAAFNTGIQAGPFNSDGAAGAAANGIFSFTYTGASADVYNSIRVRGDATSGGVGSYKNELRYRFVGASNLDSAGLASGTTWTGSIAVDNTKTFANFSMTNGTTYNIRLWESYDDPGVDATWSNLQFDFAGPVLPGPGDTQALAINLGSLGNGITSVSSSLNSATTNLKWYQFTLDAGNPNTFMDAWINPGSFDTEIGIYDAAGNLVGTDDDGGLGLLSALSYGTGSGISQDEIADGSSGAALGAGTYFIAVGGYDTAFGATGFGVTAGAGTGSFTLNMIPTPGALALLGLGGLAADRRRR